MIFFNVRTIVARHCLTFILLAIAFAPAHVYAQDEVIYYHTDAVGSVRMITDASGAVIGRYDFLPFGEAWTVPQAPDVRQFAGKERDAESGLDYFGARYYRPQSGRFVTVDPLMPVEKALPDPQRWNRFAYAGNNPLRRIDPDGRDWWDFARGAAQGALDAVVAPVALAHALWTNPSGVSDAAMQDIGLLRYGAHHPSELLSSIPELIQQGPSGHEALGRIAGATAIAALSGAKGLRSVSSEAIAVAEVSKSAITFGHGARHLVGTGIAVGDVEAAISTEIRGITSHSRIAGEFHGRTTVGSVTIEYRAFLRSDGTINVGTYYPLR